MSGASPLRSAPSSLPPLLRWGSPCTSGLSVPKEPSAWGSPQESWEPQPSDAAEAAGPLGCCVQAAAGAGLFRPDSARRQLPHPRGPDQGHCHPCSAPVSGRWPVTEGARGSPRGLRGTWWVGGGSRRRICGSALRGRPGDAGRTGRQGQGQSRSAQWPNRSNQVLKKSGTHSACDAVWPSKEGAPEAELPSQGLLGPSSVPGGKLSPGQVSPLQRLEEQGSLRR